MTTLAGRRHLRVRVGWAPAWVITRLLLVWVVIGRPGTQQDVRGDLHLYDRWSAALLHGSTAPFDDARWQYPPGAALVMAGPRLLPFSYVTDFLVLALVTDALVTLLLWRRGGTAAGAACWIAGVALLGPVAITRFDLAPSAATVAAMLVPALAGGLLIGAGAGVKLWPALLAVLPNRARGSHRPLGRALAAVLGLLIVTLPVVALDSGLATAALRHQAARGVQVESIAASPFVLAHMLGRSSAAGYSYGAFQITGAAASAIALVAIVLGGCAICFVLWEAWRPAVPRSGLLSEARADAPIDRSRRCPPLASTATAILLCLLVAYRVLSPQYLLWPLATLSVAIARAEVGARRTGGLLLGAALLTQIVYPWRYNDLLQGRPGAGAVLLSRNALLVAAAVSAVLAVRAAARSPRSSSPAARPDRECGRATSRPSATVHASAMAPPPETSSDSGRTVGSVASTRNADPAASTRRDTSPATASTAKAGARYQG